MLVTLSNTGGTTLNITGISVTGTNAGDFAQTDTCGSVIPGGNCTISVTFTPSLTTPETAAVTIADNATNSPQAVALTGTGIVSAGQFMTLSSDKTHLMNGSTGNPVFILGDTAYNLSVQLSSNTDINTYLSDRASRGINLMWIAAIDIGNHGNSISQETDAFGNDPWIGGMPFTNENPAYWAHVDYIVQQAQSYGITVLFGTAFVGGYGGCSEQYCADIEAASDATMTAYGQFLGNRYKSYPNIMWLIGGDSDIGENGSALQTKLNDLATGIASADPNHLFTVEETSTIQATGIPSYTVWGSYPWFSLDTIYPKPSGNNPTTAAVEAVSQGNASHQQSAQPTFSVEDVYDFEGGITRQQLRAEGYAEILAGAYLGRQFGSSAIWPFNAPCCNSSGTTWQAQLAAPTIVDQQTLGTLFRSREHWKMVPDINHTVVTAGYGSGSTATVTSRTSDGQTIIAYVPNGNSTTITVNMSQITSASSTANGWWFNPSSGATTLIGAFATSGNHVFTPPDSNDWILVIDDASANLTAPGGSALQ
jgi:hypothetical protein